MRQRLPPDPAPGQIPQLPSDPARPRAAPAELRATWIGHSAWLLQIGGANILTDPQLSDRASPSQWVGPRRYLPPSLTVETLPEIDAVLLSHDHYDHLDERTVRALRERFGDTVRWYTPLGYKTWFERLGVTRVTELDWWRHASFDGPLGAVRVDCVPAQHWTSRSPFSRLSRLWCSWGVSGGGRSVYFGGDSGWFPGYAAIGAHLGAADLAILPIGAYDPRWFMRPSHMNPEEAVQAYEELRAGGVFAGMHWGTFRLTDEDPLEPPKRARAAWSAAALPTERLWIAAVGETRVIPSHFGPVDPAVHPAPRENTSGPE